MLRFLFDHYKSSYSNLLMKANKPIMSLQRLVRSNDPKTGVSCKIKYIYFDSTNIIRGRYWKVFLRKAVSLKWERSFGNTYEGVSFLVKLLADVLQLCSI